MANAAAVVRVGVIMRRNPVVLRDMSVFESAFFNHKQQRDRQEAHSFPYEFYFKKGTEAEKRWIQTQKDLGADLERPIPTRSHDPDLINEMENMGPRETADDQQGNINSLNRKLKEPLFLVVRDSKIKEEGKWTLPTSQLNNDELLHEGASRLRDTLIPANANIWTVGKVPICFSRQGNEKTFYLKQILLSQHSNNNQFKLSKKETEYAWLSREELKTQVEPELYSQIKDAF